MAIDILNGWLPRWYQEEAWNYLVGGEGNKSPDGSDYKDADLIWHRRAGKDDVCLHFAAREMIQNPANYWHMLPLADQVRKAIWNAVNYHTGKRRIDEAFPDKLFNKRDSDMFIRSKVNAATWQCLGSDNFQGAIGSAPRGVVFSEWAQANPSALAYLSPIMAENRGWKIKISTPRGKNHAHATYLQSKKDPRKFGQILTIYDTWAVAADVLRDELQTFVSLYGEEMGVQHFQQEYECSFDAAIIGAIYGSETRAVRREGRVTNVAHDARYPVHVAMDIGRTDDFAMWFFQVIDKEIRFIDYIAGSGKDADEVCGLMLGRQVSIDLIRKGDATQIVVGLHEDNPYLSFRKEYRWGKIGIPHDGHAKTFVAKGKTVEEQFAAVFGWDHIARIPNLSVQDGIQASRKALARSVFDEKCEDGVVALEAYHREWDDDKKMFKDKPAHDWASHPADGFRYASVMWDFDPTIKALIEPRFQTDRSFEELVELNRRRRLARNQ
jgi:phage terminase large subunit